MFSYTVTVFSIGQGNRRRETACGKFTMKIFAVGMY